MKIENLKEGLIVKNYKEMCKLLGEEERTGNSKISQLKEWKRHFGFYKEGNKFIITEVYDEPKNKEDGRSEGNNKNGLKKYNNLKIKEDKYNNIGIYKITLNNDIYIGSTISGFRERFKGHYYGNSQSMQHTYELLQNGGVFEILHDMTGVEDEKLIRMVETEFINEYLLNPEWNVINKYESSVKIETKHKKKKKKIIKIDEDKLYEAIQLLVKHGLIDKEGVEL